MWSRQRLPLIGRVLLAVERAADVNVFPAEGVVLLLKFRCLSQTLGDSGLLRRP